MESTMRRSVVAWGAVALVAAVMLAAVYQRDAGKGMERTAVATVTPTSAGPDAAKQALPPGGRPARAPLFLDRVPTNVELADQRALARWQRQFEAAASNRIAMLLERGDARSLYEAYLLLPGSGALGDADYGRDHQAILDRARALAPDDAHLALLAGIGCGGGACDRASAIEDLLRLQPDNALGAILALDVALKAGDQAAIGRWLERAAAAGSYDMGYTRTAGDYARAFENVPAPPMDPDTLRRTLASWGLAVDSTATVDVLAISNAMGVVAAHALPSMAGLSDLCSARRVSPAHLASCHRVWRHMAGSDTVIAQAIALPQLIQLTDDPGQRRIWQEQLRDFYWTHFTESRRPDLTYLGEIAKLGEIAAARRLLDRRGITMPAGWLPDDPRYRSLILTGRPPPGD